MAEVPFDRALRSRLTANLERRQGRRHQLDGRRHAAVGLLVIDSDAELHGHDPTEFDRLDLIGDVPGVDLDTLTGKIDGTAGGAAIVLTRRAAKLRSHTKQWALPGGRIDEGETPADAAMREIEEEIGVTVTEADLLGRLDDYPTRSGYVISPFVFWTPDGAEPEANPDEVASIHRVALTELQREPRFVSIPESDRPVIQVPIGGDLIHAPTGAIIHQFHAVAVEGRDVAVDRYEQPVFAWK